MSNYIKGLFLGIGSLLTGMKVTWKEYFTKKITEQYPENRATLKMNERFCGELSLVTGEDGEYKCIACGICQMNCPNNSIRITSETVEDPETGKKKKKLIKYEYDLGSCMFCHLCMNSCPHGAIRFTTEFEHAVFTRSKLVKTLNNRR